MHPFIQHKALAAETARQSWQGRDALAPLPLPQSQPWVHITQPAAPSPPVKDWEESTDPKKKIQPFFSFKNFLGARSPGLGKFGELKKLMSTENQVWCRIRHRGKHRFPPFPAPAFLPSPRICSSLAATPPSPFPAGLTPAPS